MWNKYLDKLLINRHYFNRLLNIPARLISPFGPFIFLIFLLLFHSINYGCSLKLLSVDVPTMVIMGQPIWLNCSYDLENEELYSIKWYHWNANLQAKGEFYRWIPKDSPPGQMFQMEGIHLDLTKSSFGNVYLTSSDSFTDGSFRCEVSAEAPSFQTVRKEKELHIYSLPSEKPIIKEGHSNGNNDTSHYGPGDLINLICQTKPSRPPATLTWHINHQIADSRFVRSLPKSTTANGLADTASKLYFYADGSHFQNGLLKITCTSDIILPYTVSSEEIIIGDESKHYAQRQHTPQMVTDSMSKDIPIITGVQHRHEYRPGDIVNLTCISRAKPAPKLNFMVNDEEANPIQVSKYPIFPLSDGSFASKLGLKFKVEMENFGSTTFKQNRYYPNSMPSLSSMGKSGHHTMAIKQYRIKCLASMEKNIYNSRTEIHLGTSKQSSGLHFSENFAININEISEFIHWTILMLTIYFQL